MPEGMNPEVAELCKKKRKARLNFVKKITSFDYQERYQNLNKQVKNAVKKIKEENLEKKMSKLKEDFQKCNYTNLFRAVRELEGRSRKSLTTGKDQKDNWHGEVNNVMEYWKELFGGHLNTTFQHESERLDDIPDARNNVTKEPIIWKNEKREVVRSTKRRKAAGTDEITAEVIKAAGQPMIEMLERVSLKVWDEKQSPKDWSRMLVAPVYKKGSKRDPASYRAI